MTSGCLPVHPETAICDRRPLRRTRACREIEVRRNAVHATGDHSDLPSGGLFDFGEFGNDRVFPAIPGLTAHSRVASGLSPRFGSATESRQSELRIQNEESERAHGFLSIDQRRPMHLGEKRCRDRSSSQMPFLSVGGAVERVLSNSDVFF